jgi:nicotinate phosphoribosyltransferase
LLRQIMRSGQRLPGLETLEQARERCRVELTRLPPALRELEPAEPYPVAVSGSLRALADSVDQDLATAAAG